MRIFANVNIGCESDSETDRVPTTSDTAREPSVTRSGTESTDGAARIETQQGCCGGGASQQEDSCCGTETTGTESTCCGESEPETQESSCCGDSSCGDDGSGQSGDSGDSSRKTPAERERIQAAAERTEALLGEMADAWTPDWTEADASEFLHDRMREAGDEPAWSWEHCPAVHAGADAAVGHTLPGDRTVPAGELLHVDFGVSHEGYAADLQRVYYHPVEPGESVPDDLRAAFADVRAALDAGLRALEPGVQGHEVDAAARAELTDRGWSEFRHAFGHQVGRDAHDGGTLLGPLRDRYGDRPRGEVEAGEVYSVELGVGTPYGYVGQEEMVEVVEGGTEFVVEPQTGLRRLER